MISTQDQQPETNPLHPAMQKKLINRPRDVVQETLEGLALAHPDLLQVSYEPHLVWRKDAPVQGKAVIISGSGSGHEPLNTGYVGPGMLDAACPGGVFTSPTPDQYAAALQKVYGGAGALFVIKNYAGGVLNINFAMELAEEAGYEVQSVLVNDDVALENPDKRRGMGATVLIEKIAGAAAEAGMPLDQVAQLANEVARNARSMGVALSSCTSPNIGYPTFELPLDKIELGVGIHGERGRHRMPLATADAMTDMILEPIMQDLKLRAGNRVLALISGLGGTPLHELYIVYRHLYHALARLDISIERRLIGNYVTSLDMAGCAITLLVLTPELLELWDAPVRTPALSW